MKVTKKNSMLDILPIVLGIVFITNISECKIITLDIKEDLSNLEGWSVSSNCEYFETSENICLNSNYTDPTNQIGFWTSCNKQKCSIIYSSKSDEQNPIELSMRVYAYQSSYLNIKTDTFEFRLPINWVGWGEYPFLAGFIETLTLTVEVKEESDVIIFDKIFIKTNEIVTTTMEPSTISTTTNSETTISTVTAPETRSTAEITVSSNPTMESTISTHSIVESTLPIISTVESTESTGSTIESTVLTNLPTESTISTNPTEESTISTNPTIESTILTTPTIESTISTNPTIESTISTNPTIESTMSTTPEIESSISTNPTIESTISTTPAIESSISSNPTIQSTIFTTPTKDSSISTNPTMESMISTTPTIEYSISTNPTIESTISTTSTKDSSISTNPTIESTISTTPTIESSISTIPTLESTVSTNPTKESTISTNPIIESTISTSRPITSTLPTNPTVKSTISTFSTAESTIYTNPTVEFLDTSVDMTEDSPWSTDCVYANTLKQLREFCPNVGNINPDPENKTGYWTPCNKISCKIIYTATITNIFINQIRYISLRVSLGSLVSIKTDLFEISFSETGRWDDIPFLSGLGEAKSIIITAKNGESGVVIFDEIRVKTYTDASPESTLSTESSWLTDSVGTSSWTTDLNETTGSTSTTSQGGNHTMPPEPEDKDTMSEIYLIIIVIAVCLVVALMTLLVIITCIRRLCCKRRRTKENLIEKSKDLEFFRNIPLTLPVPPVTPPPGFIHYQNGQEYTAGLNLQTSRHFSSVYPVLNEINKKTTSSPYIDDGEIYFSRKSTPTYSGSPASGDEDVGRMLPRLARANKY